MATRRVPPAKRKWKPWEHLLNATLLPKRSTRRPLCGFASVNDVDVGDKSTKLLFTTLTRLTSYRHSLTT